MLMYAVAVARLDVVLSPEQLADEKLRGKVLAEQLKVVAETYAWIIPVGCGVGLCGMIALMLAWVSRPLGGDTPGEQTDGELTAASDDAGGGDPGE